MPRFTVAFSANLYVEVKAKDEEDARDKATEIADIQANIQAETLIDECDWIVINPDDIVSVTWDGEEDE